MILKTLSNTPGSMENVLAYLLNVERPKIRQHVIK